MPEGCVTKDSMAKGVVSRHSGSMGTVVMGNSHKMSSIIIFDFSFLCARARAWGEEWGGVEWVCVWGVCVGCVCGVGVCVCMYVFMWRYTCICVHVEVFLQHSLL